MLDGLEVSEVSLNDVLVDNVEMRIDSEYFKKQYLSINTRLKEINSVRLATCTSEIIHPTEILRVYEESGIQILLAQNVRNNLLDLTTAVYMNQAKKAQLLKNRIQFDDMIMTRSGANFGQTACFKYDEEIYACADVLVLRPQDVPGGYLSTYFNSEPGRALLNRGAYGMAQPHIAPTYLRKLFVPIFPRLHAAIDQLVNEAKDLLEDAKQIYADAEAHLLKEITLFNWNPLEQSVSIRRASEVFSTQRFDAEHFQPHYWKIRDTCSQYAGGAEFLGELASSITNGVESREFVEEGVPYLRVGDMRMLRIDPQSPVLIPKSEAEALKSKIELEAGDVLIARSGSIGQAAVVTPEHIDSILSSHLMRIRLKANSPVQPMYFALFMATLPGVQQVLMHSNGGVVPEISQPNLKLVVVPLLKKEIQDRLAELIEESHKTENSARALLDKAKEAVNIAIKSDEKTALKLLKRARN